MDVYIETSALNFFRGMLSNEDAFATRTLQRERGRRWKLSAVTVWEVLLTRNLDRKESLISLAQHLLDKEILPAPEEILIKYIEQGCPLEEPRRLLISQSNMAATWRDLYTVPEKTFVYDELYLRAKARSLGMVVHDLYRLLRHRSVTLTPYTNDSSYDITLEQLTERLSIIKDYGPLDDYHKGLYKVAIFYILFLLCAGIGIQPEGIVDFWRQQRLTRTVDRLMYLLSEHETLVYRGPIAQMAVMTIVQASGTYSRGLFWDCLHAFYLTYADAFFAEDAHFAQLRAHLKNHPNARKILKPTELEWTWKTKTIERKSIIVT